MLSMCWLWRGCLLVVDVSKFESRLEEVEVSVEQSLFERVLSAAIGADRVGLFLEVDVILGQDASLSREDVELVWGSSKFQRSLRDRGIKTSADPNLTLRQETFLQAYLNPLNLKPPHVVAKQLKIGAAELDGWLRDKHFAHAMKVKSEENLVKFLPIADQALGQLVQAGDMKAIQFVNQLTGRFDPNARQQLDVPALLMQVQDIVLRHVRDPITKRNIARELVALAQGNSFGSVIPEPMPDAILVSETVIDVTPNGEV
jgi:hypothetical protein